MEDIKIANILREFGSEPFSYSVVNPEERLRVFSQMARLTGLKEDGSADAVTKAISERGDVVFGFDATAPKFDFSELVRHLGIATKTVVYFDQMNSRAMDRLALEDICKYFEYLWYPSSDDVLILDTNMNWIVTITHYGEIRFYRISRPSTQMP